MALELAAATQLLDEQHVSPLQVHSDNILYHFGRISTHNVIIACGLRSTSIADVASQLTKKFKSIQFGLSVGLACGIPSEKNDIRIGDVVVGHSFASDPTEDRGVVQYSSDRDQIELPNINGCNSATNIFRTAVSVMNSNAPLGKLDLKKELSAFSRMQTLRYHRETSDVFHNSCSGHSNDTYEYCAFIVENLKRVRTAPAIHYGRIAWYNRVVKDGETKDWIRSNIGGVLCFEGEAAGLSSRLECLVIRGICDYGDI